ncbi:hypothetical protein E5K00_18245 [Hymenobacter aquaticus]|uniref:Uncharacterized protein n=1 Tax=Hymenobacter aquaticus TaxID=1867101 RepID=A0A4Z0PY07_9BACT|nr:hypothetical protein [Hymenobacter aquaticus]TGE22189.1 hypothetical protein E5K00_18245 [Hymenobacter aquaticus]
MNRLLLFAEQVLRLTPAWLWWALAGFGFGGINLVFYQEFWPNSPAAGSFFKGLVLVSLMAIPLAMIQTVRNFARTLQSSFWRLLWQLILFVGFLGACAVLLIILSVTALLYVLR